MMVFMFTFLLLYYAKYANLKAGNGYSWRNRPKGALIAGWKDFDCEPLHIAIVGLSGTHITLFGRQYVSLSQVCRLELDPGG